MINIDAEIYREFTCKADKCKHTCCRGWEIDIDDDTLDYYNSLDTELGNEIRKNISGCGQEGESASFMLTTDERCPFLKYDGLCRIIEELGDDGLCDICRLHPRFYEIINDYNLAGVGLSCEKASELLFGKKSLDFIICGSEKKISFTEILDLLKINISHDYLKLSCLVPDYLAESKIEKILDIFFESEPIDDNWKREVQLLKNSYRDYVTDLEFDKYEIIYQYIIFRQLEMIRIYGTKKIIEYAIYSIIYIMLYAKCINDDIEAVRRWSEQIEYNEDSMSYFDSCIDL